MAQATEYVAAEHKLPRARPRNTFFLVGKSFLQNLIIDRIIQRCDQKSAIEEFHWPEID
jgi:hypothetical protein